MVERFEKNPERIDKTLKDYIKAMQTHSRDKTERAQLILFDIVATMARGSYVFAKLAGIAKDLAASNATYSIKAQMIKCSKGCDKCPHGPYYYLYYRVQQKQNSRYLGKSLWK